MQQRTPVPTAPAAEKTSRAGASDKQVGEEGLITRAKARIPRNYALFDAFFARLSGAAAATIIATVVAIGAFLIWRAVPAMQRNTAGIGGFFTSTEPWDLSNTQLMHFGIANLLAVTVLTSAIALLLAMPVGLGIAIFLAAYSPARLARPLGAAVDMLAAVPSIVYGLWGWQVLGPALGRWYEQLAQLGALLPFFRAYPNSPSFDTGRNILTGAIVLSIMILPVIAATTREVFVQTPKGHIEAALALGATRWEVVRLSILPFGFRGFVSGSMLGLGRALGETMALYMVIASAQHFRFSLFDGGTTFATAIANAAPEFNDDLRAGAYIAAGLALFALTFVVNSVARGIVTKRTVR